MLIYLSLYILRLFEAVSVWGHSDCSSETDTGILSSLDSRALQLKRKASSRFSLSPSWGYPPKGYPASPNWVTWLTTGAVESLYQMWQKGSQSGYSLSMEILDQVSVLRSVQSTYSLSRRVFWPLVHFLKVAYCLDRYKGTCYNCLLCTQYTYGKLTKICTI